MILVVSPSDVAKATELLKQAGETVYHVGTVCPRSEIPSKDESVLVENTQAWSI
jgi:hypothetical protein